VGFVGKGSAQKVAPPSAAVFAFPGLNYTVEAEGTTEELPQGEDCIFMWSSDGQVRAEVNRNSIEIMEGLGWLQAPPKG
jgi:hypothetical protein